MGNDGWESFNSVKQNNLKETVQTKAEEQQSRLPPTKKLKFISSRKSHFFILLFILTISCDLLKFTNEKHINSF